MSFVRRLGTLWPWAAVFACSIALQTFGGLDSWAYLRDGSHWRVLSGSFVHVSWTHLALNFCALALLVRLFGWGRDPRAVALLVVLGVACSGLEAAFGNLAWVCGLSGALHGLAVVGAVVALRSGYSAVLLFCVAGKLVTEAVAGTAGTSALIGAPVAGTQHIYGAAAGCVLALCWVLYRRARLSIEQPALG